MRFLLRVALLAVLALVLGCGAEPTQPIAELTLRVGDAAQTEPIVLPIHLTGRLPREKVTFSLAAKPTLLPDLRGRALVLANPHLTEKARLFVGGLEMFALNEVGSGAYRHPGPQAWRIPRELTQGPTLDIELVVEHGWLQGAYLDTIPRLSATEDGDVRFRLVRVLNEIGCTAALATCLPFAFMSIVLFLLDRRRKEHCWLAIYYLAASILPAFLLGHTQYILGSYDGRVLSVSIAVLVIAGISFTRSVFGLGLPLRAYSVLLAIVVLIAIFGANVYGKYGILVPAVVAVVVVSVAHHILTMGLRRRTTRYRHSFVILLAWGMLLLSLASDVPPWLALGEPFEGLRVAPWCITVASLFQILGVARDLVLTGRQGEQLNLELAARVELLESQKAQIQVLNDELRRQIKGRSQNISAMLTSMGAVVGAQRLAPGEVVEERYRVIGVVGEGGMGCVYEVERLADKRRLALKVLTHVSSGVELARFAREAQIASSVDDPNVVAILDVDIAKAGYLFLVMELVRGVSLASRRERFGDVAWALPVLRGVASGLAGIHARAVVHRDLKPGNVLLSDEGDPDTTIVKISDFGISTFVRENDVSTMRLDDGPELTVTGAVIGTPHYMAPEAARGGKSAQPSADVFSFGVLAFEVLTGKRPFKHPPAVALLKESTLPGPPASLAESCPGLDPAVAALLDRALAMAPDERPTAGQIADALAVATGARA